MDNGMQEMLQLIIDKIDKLDKKIDTVDKKVDVVDRKVEDTRLFIENDVMKRIDALFDGYKLTHEKQYELEHKMIALEQRLEKLEQRVG